jgi:predicted nucleic acid-binding protein
VLDTLIAALQTSAADCLIIDNKGLLALADRNPIVTPANFWAKHVGR